MSRAVAVDVSQLILGRQLTGPIYDTHGVLLLAAGCTFGAEHQRTLVNRGIRRVLIGEQDACHAVAKVDAAEEKRLAEMEERVNERIEQMIRSGQFQVVNTGPPVKAQVVRHGRKTYDRKHQEAVQRERREHADVVDQLMRGVLHGTASGRNLGGVASACIQSLSADLDGTLSMSSLSNASAAEHSLSLATLAMAVGIDLGLDLENVRRIGITGLLQDVGMSSIPAEILHAARRLTPGEFVEVQKHVVRTADALERLRGIPSLVQLVAYQVHERMDGSGYPRQREGGSIHLFARILHVADAYVALTTPRPFRPALMPHAAMVCLLRQASQRVVDANVVRSLLHVLSLFPTGSYVTLSDGSVARVMRANGEQYAQPIVLRVRDAGGNRLDPDDESSLIDLRQSDLTVIQALPTPGREELPFTDDLLTLTVPSWSAADDLPSDGGISIPHVGQARAAALASAG